MAQSPRINREPWIRLSLTWRGVLLVSGVIISPLVWTVGASVVAGPSLRCSARGPGWVSFQHYGELCDGAVA
ncbi:sugar ABC transporter permease, partial [Klebsiella pneumoniae]|nr:sugar ABC transporter permease [Klebsiella pneumoniae]